VSEMDEKERDLAKAQSIRTEYTRDLEEITFWLGRAEAKVQDRNAEPHVLKSQLDEVSYEVGGAADQLERLNRNGQVLMEKAALSQDRELAHSTCANVTQQLSHLRHILEQKKMAVSGGRCNQSLKFAVIKT
jgi:chromosome segregation ATPase